MARVFVVPTTVSTDVPDASLVRVTYHVDVVNDGGGRVRIASDQTVSIVVPQDIRTDTELLLERLGAHLEAAAGLDGATVAEQEARLNPADPGDDPEHLTTEDPL